MQASFKPGGWETEHKKTVEDMASYLSGLFKPNEAEDSVVSFYILCHPNSNL